MPYLLSVSDPYDTLSPYHDWGPVLIGASSAGKALGLAGPLVALQTVAGPSKHVESATAVGQEGELSLSGTEVEADLGLRSTWFEVGWLGLTPPPSPVPFGDTVTLKGVVRGLGSVSLEEQSQGSAWQLLAAILPGAGGAFSIEVTPQATTRYRLASGAVRGALINVPVAPVVNASLVSSGVEGSLEPQTAGETVLLQRERGSAWATLASARTGRGRHLPGSRRGSRRAPTASAVSPGPACPRGLSGLLLSGASGAGS